MSININIINNNNTNLCLIAIIHIDYCIISSNRTNFFFLNHKARVITIAEETETLAITIPIIAQVLIIILSIS